MLPETFHCYLVTKDAGGNVTGRIEQRRIDDLPEGEVIIRVAYSSLNYKDALAATGHPGVNKVFPHIPGVDIAGTVVQSGVYEAVEGDKVLATGFHLGSNRWGGWAEYARVPLDWIVPLPDGLTLRESMMLGTAGLTAAMCVDALLAHDVTPELGDVVVTGASGGVGSISVAILARLGYQVVAVTGKPEAHEMLRSLGAQEILPREAVNDTDDRPMLSGRWAGGVDTVGGNTLGTVLRGVRHGGCVAACGMAGGTELPITVYPFILRAITLTGIDAAFCSDALRHESWARLAGPWKPEGLDRVVRFITMDQLGEKIDQILAGRLLGRCAVEIGGEPEE